MKYIKAEVELIMLDNIDIVTYSGCDDGVWYNDAPEEVYDACAFKGVNGWKKACQTIKDNHWYDPKGKK